MIRWKGRGVGRSISALEVVRNKRAKQLLAEKVIKVTLWLKSILNNGRGGEWAVGGGGKVKRVNNAPAQSSTTNLP